MNCPIHFRVARVMFAFCFCVALVVGGCSKRIGSTRRATFSEVRDSLAQLAVELRKAVGDGDRYPERLSQLPSDVNPRLLVCPGSGSVAGPIGRAEEWTDYVYLGNVIEIGIAGLPVVISPPENHGGIYGVVLFNSGRVERLPAQNVRELIAEPFMLAAGTTAESIAHERGLALLNIPKKFEGVYGPTRKP